jgi:hypothetical protein
MVRPMDLKVISLEAYLKAEKESEYLLGSGRRTGLLFVKFAILG